MTNLSDNPANRETSAIIRTRILRCVFAALILNITGLIWGRFPSYFYQTAADGSRVFYFPYTLLCLTAAIGSAVLVLLPRRLPRKAGWVLSAAALVIWPALDYLVSEAALETGCNYLHLRRYSMFLNIWVYCVAELIVLVLTLDVRAAVIGGTLLMFIFTGANIYITEFRGIPLYLTDLVDIGTAADVAGSYTLDLNKGILLLLLFLFFTCVLMSRIWPKKQKYIEKRKHRAVLRLIGIPAGIAVTVFSMWYIIRSPYPRRHGIRISSFRPAKSYVSNGAMLAFLRSGSYLFVDAPEGYSKEVITELEETYPSDSVSEADLTSVPNVIVIMDESFADLQSVGDFETNIDVMPFIHSLEENTIKGESYVSVFGGHTANSEYEFITGNSCTFFAVGTPYVLYIKSPLPNFTTYLQDLGTETALAMHPYSATNYNRAVVYENFGFDAFLSASDFGDDAEIVRRLISDKADFDKIIESYEAAKADSDAPFFMFNVTVQNHSPYSREDTNLPQEVTITSEGVADVEKAEQYLNLIHLTDQSLQELVEYFEAQEDPTVIVFFGDHEPSISNAFFDSILPKAKSELSSEEAMALYKTPFFIWANFPIESAQNVKTSLNYLSLMMKETAGLPLTGYDKFLQQLQEKLPVLTDKGSFDADGNYYSTTSANSPYAEDIDLYEYLVYNHLFGGTDRSSMFSLAE